MPSARSTAPGTGGVRRRRALLLCLALLACAALAPAAASAEAAPRPVKLMTVQAPSGEVTRRFFGRALARQTVDLAFQVAGQVVRLPALEGRIVPAGETVAALDAEPFRLALERARLERDRAVRHAARMQALEGTGASRVSAEDAATEAGLAEIALRKARRDLRLATLVAPFDALVARRAVANLATVRAGEPVVRLHDMSELRIAIDVPEVLFQRAGRDPDVALFARFPAAKRRYPVEVREHSAETSRIGQTFRVTLGMAPPADFTVLPGSSVTVIATLRRADTRAAVPASAVVTGAGGATSVMVFRPGEGDAGTVESRPVTLGVGRDGALRVVEGLEPGAEIVAAGAHLLGDGERVRRFGGFGD